MDDIIQYQRLASGYVSALTDPTLKTDVLQNSKVARPTGLAVLSLLGALANFAILAKTAITDVAPSVIVGDLGISPAAASSLTGWSELLPPGGFRSTSAQVTGFIYASDYAAPTPANLTAAILAMESAYTYFAGLTPNFTNLYGGHLGGRTLTPGIYKWTTNVDIATSVTLNGGPDDIFVLITTGTLTQIFATNVILTGGAVASNVYWVSAGVVAIGAGSIANGIYLSKTRVALFAGATVNGQIFAQTQVTLDLATVNLMPAGSPPFVGSYDITIGGNGPEPVGIGDSRQGRVSVNIRRPPGATVNIAYGADDLPKNDQIVHITATLPLLVAPPLASTAPIVAPPSGAPGTLATLANFAILDQTGTTGGAGSAVVGDVGVSPAAAATITGFGPLGLVDGGTRATSPVVTGFVYASDYAAPTPANLTADILAMQAAYTYFSSLAPNFSEFNAGAIGGLTLAPGVYKWTTAVTIATDVTLEGGADDVFVFITTGGIAQTAAMSVLLAGGVQAKNVYWVTAGVMSFGAAANGQGIYLSQTSITLAANATVHGQLFAQTDVTLITNPVTLIAAGTALEANVPLPPVLTASPVDIDFDYSIERVISPAQEP